MNRYVYHVTGLYKDWCRIEKDHITYHDGSVFGLLSKEKEDLIITINFASKINYRYKLREHKNYIIGIPWKMTELFSGESDSVLILTSKEFERLIDIVYLDKEYIRDIKKCTSQELQELWFYQMAKYLDYKQENCLKEQVLSQIIGFSDEDMNEVKLQDILAGKLNIYLNDCTSEEIIYLDMARLIEWKSLLKKDQKYYLKLDEDFMLGS